jgi:hypothetical protein
MPEATLNPAPVKTTIFLYSLFFNPFTSESYLNAFYYSFSFISRFSNSFKTSYSYSVSFGLEVSEANLELLS